MRMFLLPQKTTRFEAVKVFHSPKSDNLPLKVGEVRVHLIHWQPHLKPVRIVIAVCVVQRVDAVRVPDDDFWVHATKVSYGLDTFK